MQESKLIELASQGDETAFESLVRARHQRVYWLAYRVVGNAEDAKDITQAVFIRLWKVLDKYDPKYPFSTWLHRIVMNLAIDHVRRETRHVKDVDSLEDRTSEIGEQGNKGQEAEMARSELFGVFQALASELPPKQRAVFVLREMEELSTDEVTEILGVSASTVRNHLFQARRTLREALETRFPEYLPVSRQRREQK